MRRALTPLLASALIMLPIYAFSLSLASISVCSITFTWDCFIRLFLSLEVMSFVDGLTGISTVLQ